MRLAFIYIVLAMILASCGKTIDNGGPYTISGTLLNNCEDQEPVANEELYFLVDWEAPEEERFATTDADGNFEYTFEGPPNNESVIGGTIRLTNEKVVLAGIPNSSFEKDMNAGTIYVNPPQEAEITFRIQGAGFTNQDTLFVGIVWHPDMRRVYNFKVSGPFDKEKIIVQNDWKKYASSGVKTMPNPFKTPHPYTRRLNGTFGTKCHWQLRRNGAVLHENNEQILLDDCETVGELEINPNNGYNN